MERPLTNLPIGQQPQPTDSILKRSLSNFNDDIFTVRVFYTDFATQNDSGFYNCTATNGNELEGISGIVSTTRAFQVIVQGDYT